jgi:transcriptional regulator with XRE-family HTH domain
MPPSHQQAGAEVRRLRTDKGWTHEDMSAEIFRQYGVRYQTSARTVWRVESGHKPGVRKQYAIAMVLGVRPSQLWDSSERRATA